MGAKTKKTKNVTFTADDAQEFALSGSKDGVNILKGLGGPPIEYAAEATKEAVEDKAKEIIEEVKQEAIKKTKRWFNPVEWLKWGVGCPVGEVALCAGGGRRKTRRKRRRKTRRKRKRRKTRRKRKRRKTRRKRRKRLGRKTRRKQRGGGCGACLALL